MEYKCSIIANPEGQAWDFATKIYETLQGRSDSFELNRVTIKQFRDGECKPKIELNVRKKNCFFIHDSNLKPADWTLQLLLVNEALHNSSSHEVVDILPYLKFSRQDRKDESRTSQSAKALTSVIEPYANRGLTIDLHNPAIQGFYNIPFDNLYSSPTVARHIREHHQTILEDLIIMSPDVGGAARARAFAKKLGKDDIAVGYKIRPKEGEVGEVRVLGDLQKRCVLIVDDILDSGNTLVKACAAARGQGAIKVYTYCTHALFTQGIEKVTGCFEKIFIGNTVRQPEHEKLEVISFVPLFAEAIERTNEGKSLSELFE